MEVLHCLVWCWCSRQRLLMMGHHHRSTDYGSPGLPSPAESTQRTARRPVVKKPLNAFMLFMKEMRQKVIDECTLKESAAINQILGRKVITLTDRQTDTASWADRRHILLSSTTSFHFSVLFNVSNQFRPFTSSFLCTCNVQQSFTRTSLIRLRLNFPLYNHNPCIFCTPGVGLIASWNTSIPSQPVSLHQCNYVT